MSSFNHVTLEAQGRVERKRKLMSPETHLYDSQGNDILEWGTKQLAGEDVFAALDQRVVSIDEHRLKLGLIDKLPSSAGTFCMLPAADFNL